MKVSAKDKRLIQLMSTPSGKAVKGLQPAEAYRIRIRIDLLLVADDITQVASAHPEWRVHQWKGNKQWSVDVLANTRLLFDYDIKAKEISNMTYDDPH